MTFRLFRQQVYDVITASLKSTGYSDLRFDLSEPPRKEFGDLMCNIAFLLSKQMKMPPPKIAAELIEKHIRPAIMAARQDGSFTLIKSVEPHPAGYINFRANYDMLTKYTLEHALKNPDGYGYYYNKNNYHHHDNDDDANSLVAQNIVLEHTSVNPNKALHVGHMRNVILGDTLYRIMKAANNKDNNNGDSRNVTVLNYVDDSGLQVADIIIGFRFAGFPQEPPKGYKFDQYCGDEVYVKVNQMYQSNPSLAEKRKLVLQEIEEGKSEIAQLAARITKRVLDEQLKTCWRMKVHYDVLNFESQIVHSQMWSKIFEILKKEGLARFEEEGKNKGCWVIEAGTGSDSERQKRKEGGDSQGEKRERKENNKGPGEGERETQQGEKEGEEDKVLVRSDGTATYIAKDIPYAAWKLGLISDPFSYVKYSDQWDNTPLYATTLKSADSKQIQNDDEDNDKEKRKDSINYTVDFRGKDNKVITIIDSRQARLQKIISQVLGKIDTNAKHDYQHLGYEAVTLSANTAKMLGIDIGDRQFMHMSGRKGIYVSADFVLDHLKEKAKEEVKKRNPELSDKQVERISEEIGISAIRYNMIRQDLDKIITFDINESMSLEGDTGPYLQYAYARSQRILEKAGIRNPSDDDDDDYNEEKKEKTDATANATATLAASSSSPSKEGIELAIAFSHLLNEEAEIELIKEISKMDIIIEDAARSLSPKALARYSHNLATTFNAFYEKIPVLKAQDKNKLAARLALVQAFGIALRNSLSVLGITALPKM